MRSTRCPKCESLDVETVKIHNPDTHDMNSNATLKCRTCGHVWEGRITSEYHLEQRRRGVCI